MSHTETALASTAVIMNGARAFAAKSSPPAAGPATTALDAVRSAAPAAPPANLARYNMGRDVPSPNKIWDEANPSSPSKRKGLRPRRSDQWSEQNLTQCVGARQHPYMECDPSGGGLGAKREPLNEEGQSRECQAEAERRQEEGGRDDPKFPVRFQPVVGFQSCAFDMFVGASARSGSQNIRCVGCFEGFVKDDSYWIHEPFRGGLRDSIQRVPKARSEGDVP